MPSRKKSLKKSLRKSLKNLKKLSFSKSKQICSNKNMIPMYTQHVSEPWFTLIALGIKSVEGRLDKSDFKKMNPGDTVLWYNDDFGHRSVMTRILRKTRYNTFKEYLQQETLPKTLPGILDIDKGVNDVYFKYFNSEKEAEHGVVAIQLEIV